MREEYNPIEIEKEVMEFWKKNNIYESLKASLKKKKKFFHLDGPPYVTGDPHPGTAWNRCMKDVVRRYKRMQGFDVWDQPGFDMHGLPIEHSVETKYGIHNKKEIEEYGVNKFINECRNYSIEYMNVMIKIFERLGEWADWKNPYMTIKNSYIEGVWWMIKQAWKKKLLYQGLKVLTWCPRCGTALAGNYEVTHKTLSENSVFVKLPVIGKEKEYLIIWTTTPWTLPCNMGVMANPELDYVKVKVKDEIWILALGLVHGVMANVDEKYEIIEEFKGEKLLGLKYEHPFEKEVSYHQKEHGKSSYSVVLSEKYVNLSAGSGLVHCAPGCGPEDYEVGMEYKIPAFNPVDEYGKFTKKGGKFEGMSAKIDDGKFTSSLKDKGLLIAQTEVEHEYPHCERCKSPVIFRPTEQWFLKVTALKEKMLEENEKVKWVPEWAGTNQFKRWIENVRDWCISRQRFWGVPLPVWKCSECGKIEVMGSSKDIEKNKVKMPKDFHKPNIDKVKWKCSCKKGEMKRIPDVVDVWIDSACAPFASLEYPRHKKLFDSLGNQSDFILEAKDQIRGWFYSLMGAGTICFEQVPYKSVFMHGWMNDETGRGMSKRLGNYESMETIIKDFGADIFRFYTISSTSPGMDVNYSRDEMKEAYKALNVLWNVSMLLIKNTRYAGCSPKKIIKKQLLKTEDRWILSKLNSKIKTCTELLENYEINRYAVEIKNFFLEDISRTYIKFIRNRLDVAEKAEKENILSILYKVVIDTLTMLSPLLPFISERIFQNMKEEYNLPEKSVHGLKWPKYNSNNIDLKLEMYMDVMQDVLQSALASREKAGINLRWPVGEIMVLTNNKEVEKSLQKTKDVLLEQANAKSYKLIDVIPKGIVQKYKMKYDNIKNYGSLVPEIVSDVSKTGFDTIKKNLDEKGFLGISVKGEKIKLKKEDFEYEEELPASIKSSDFRYGKIYLKAELTKELLAEGFAREIKRRIQQIRKKLELKKPDRIKAMIFSDKELASSLKTFRRDIAKVTGCDELAIVPEDKTKYYDYNEKFGIKDKEVSIGITVLNKK
ncbi:MAG: isoleucine--tRNA ligase [Candidatus Nanoarchaeia archaeon]|nr:isoleucine--tRNA ligase [Candidatus Nanoarchaeia archaeon]